MNPIYVALCLIAALGGPIAASGGNVADGQQSLAVSSEPEAVINSNNLGQQQQQESVSQEMRLITKSLEDLLAELAMIKREANGRLSNLKLNRASTNQQEQIRQAKVSQFVLNRVAQLEAESRGMRDELARLFQLKPATPLYAPLQEDQDFDEPATTSGPTTRPTSAAPPASSSTTRSPAEAEAEAAKLGFDMEALKKLGSELESEIEARQQQTPESLRGVHEQVIRLVDNMVQNYLANVRRTVQRMTNFIDSTRSNQLNSKPRQGGQQQQVAAKSAASATTEELAGAEKSVLEGIQDLSKSVHEFSIQWAKMAGKQQSPLIDRIPSRGMELWRDFWDTVRKQVRRINQEFVQVSRDMSRVLTGRLPSVPAPGSSLLYSPETDTQEQTSKHFRQFYEKMSVALGEQQQKMDELNRIAHSQAPQEQKFVDPKQVNNHENLIDEHDDQVTKDELTRNVALRQQIQQEINVFSSIFDIMQTFIQRLRESASNAVRDVMRPGASGNVDNNPVTPGPAVKPQVDQLLGETINSQRNINSQAKPVLLPNSRPSVGGPRA